jgi:putative Flp pilus-assembly TadE/G-like protein
MRPARSDRGQVLIITAFAMIVLLAIAAIVVDLGFSWMLHRKEQNAADPAALAAAKYVPAKDMAKMEAEACFYAQANGFFVSDANCAAALASGDLDVNSPPSSAMAGQYRGHFGYVEVIINSTHPSFFGQVFGRPFASVKSEAVAALTSGDSNSASLVALGDSCQPPNDGDSAVTGGGTLTIHPATGVITPGGYINVNAPCGTIGNPQACDGNGNASALAVTGGSTLSTPHAFVVGGCGRVGASQFKCYPAGATGCLDEQAIPLGDPLASLPEPWPTISLPVPLCPKASEINSPSDSNPCTLSKTGGANAPCPTGTCVMEPGIYYAGWDIQGSVAVVMKPGMYVFAGFGIKMSAQSSLTSIAGGTPGNPIDARVTIFSTDYTPGCLANRPNFCEGAITINSAGPLRLKATDTVTCQQVSPAICPWTGILLWQDGTTVGTPQDVSISGQSDLILSGTIYAPKSKVTITGGNSTGGCTTNPEFCLAIQIIARQWVISGGAVIDMPYDPSQLYHLEQQGLVH